MRRLKTILQVALALLVLAVLAGGLGYLWLRGAPRSVPEGQPPLARLDTSSLQAFRETFNAHRQEVRILAMLSPT